MKIENIVKCKLDEIREVKHNENILNSNVVYFNKYKHNPFLLSFFNFIILFGFQKTLLLLICDYYCRWSALFAILNIFLNFLC